MPLLTFDSLLPTLDNPDMESVLIRPEGDLVMRGLRVMLAGPERAAGIHAHRWSQDIEAKLEGFLNYARSVNLNTRRQVVSVQRAENEGEGTDRIVGMCLWVPAAGRTAMLFAPPMSEYSEAAIATQAAISAALEDARAAGIVLVQAIMEPNDIAGQTVFTAAGLSQLAKLTYMERRPPVQPPAFSLPDDLTLAPYETSTHALFRQAILGSYEQTLDCPAFSGMRDVDDVIEGHKAVGPFDPQLWGVLLRWGKPVGCLLLSEIPARQALELVYLGLAPAARGQGLGRLLMQRVLAIAARRHFELATLAVDTANTPALRLYRRCGYTSVAQRVAMVRKLI